MSRPATRLLGFLELLQGAPSIAGADAAARLGVDGRTVRRYVGALQELGIPVEGQRGAGGGYRLAPGYRLPPLMLGDDEAVAVVAGLLAVRRLGLAGAEPGLAKVRRVLPATLRRQVEALESVVAFTDAGASTIPPVGATLLVLAEGALRHRRVAATYTPPDGAPRRRELDPFGVVVHFGRWYVSARAAESGEARTFRVDRLSDAVLGAPAAPPPEDFDAVAAVTRSLARVPWAHAVEVWLAAPEAAIAQRLPAGIAELSAADGENGAGTLMRMRADSLRWVAELLAGLGCAFVVHTPEALRDEVRAVAAVLTAAAAAKA